MNESVRSIRYLLLCIALMSGLTPSSAVADAAPKDDAPRLQSLLAPAATELRSRPLTIKGWQTTAGSKVLFIRTTASPMFDVHVSFAAGSERDNATPGLAGATFSMLNEGITGMESYAAISEALHSLGAQLGMGIDQKRAALSLRSLSEETKSTPALLLFTQMLGKPLLSDEALVRVKNEFKNKLQLHKQNPHRIVVQRLFERLAPQSPYAHTILGTDEGLASLTRQAVQDFHRQAYSARTARITLVGDLTLERAQQISQQISSALPDTALTKAKVPPPASVSPPTSEHIERPLQQTHLLLAQLSVPRKHDDYLALHAANMIFGEGPNSRLMTELREKRGLVYDASIEAWNWADRGLTVITLQTGPQFSQGTQAFIRSMFNDYLRDGPTQQELDRLKRRLTNMNAHNSASNAQILARLDEINRYDLPLDLDDSARQMQRLTLKQIKDALSRHLAADRWYVVTVGPTTEQQPLPSPVLLPADTSSANLCRAGSEFVAS